MKTFSTHSADETTELGRRLAAELRPGSVVLLRGELGAGKTTLVKGIAEGFGAAEADLVTSPTFTLIHEYRGPQVTLYHIDLYRIDPETPNSLDGLGLEEIFDDPNAAVIIEWAERLGSFDTTGAIRVFLSYVDDHSRKIEIK